MQLALEILGYGPVAHGGHINQNILELEMVRDGLEAKFRPETARCKPFGRAEFDQLLGEYRAVTDAPYCHFGPELMAAYPDAKVILVERDIDSWFESFRNTVATMPFRRRLRNRLENLVMPDLRRQREAFDAIIGYVCNACNAEEVVAHARDVYTRHYREIRAAARPGQVLEYDLRSGWQPLCEFLGKPVPDVPFPRVNDTATFQRDLSWFRFLLTMKALLKLALGGVRIIITLIALKYYYYMCLQIVLAAAESATA